MKSFIDRLMKRPAVVHLLAANNRYNMRLGPQFAAAVTYFSILSIVPVLMFTIAATGFTLTVLRPDLWEAAQSAIQESVGGEGDLGKFIEDALNSWRAFGIIAILSAAYTGSNWIGNLKRAFRVMWRAKFSQAAEKRGFIGELLENLAIFLGLLLCVLIAFGSTVVGVAFSETILEWLGMKEGWLGTLAVKGITISLTLVAGWILFAFLFITLPGETTTKRSFIGGTIAGAVVVMLIQQLAGLLFGAFSGNPAAAVFGPVIVLMLVFNTLATLILMIAAWVGTAHTYEEEMERAKRQKAAGITMDVDEEDDDVPAPVAASREQAEIERERNKRWEATRSKESLRVENFDPEEVPQPDAREQVNQEVAVKGMRVASGVGYGLGTATGLGIGALIVSLFKRK